MTTTPPPGNYRRPRAAIRLPATTRRRRARASRARRCHRRLHTVAHAGARGSHRLRALCRHPGDRSRHRGCDAGDRLSHRYFRAQIGDVCATGNSTLGVAAVLVSALAGLAYVAWNLGYKQGTTGSSIGKSIMKFKVVSEQTGQPIGFGPSILRQIAHIVDGVICYIGYLFPLWDAKRQTMADKIMSTVCLPTT